MGKYLPTGHLVYVCGGALFAVPFDRKRLEVTGPERPVIEGVMALPVAGFAGYACSESAAPAAFH